MRLFTSVTIAASLLITTFITPAEAAVNKNCQPVFNGGASCAQSDVLAIDKTVMNPLTNLYVDNLKTSDATFAPAQTVSFRITVTNSSNNALSNISVKDIYPQYVDYKTGNGSYDAKSRTFTFTIDSLSAHESRVYFLSGIVAAADKLPANQNSLCVVNQAIGMVNNKKSQDNAQFCLNKPTQTTAPTTTKGGTPVYKPSPTKKTPSTGPEALSLLSLLPIGAAGAYLRRKSSK
jgi:uncharacterized repeat protein (TIGR01451 family)